MTSQPWQSSPSPCGRGLGGGGSRREQHRFGLTHPCSKLTHPSIPSRQGRGSKKPIKQSRYYWLKWSYAPSPRRKPGSNSIKGLYSGFHRNDAAALAKFPLPLREGVRGRGKPKRATSFRTHSPL